MPLLAASFLQYLTPIVLVMMMTSTSLLVDKRANVDDDYIYPAE